MLAGCVFGSPVTCARRAAFPVAVLLSEAATRVTRDVNPLPETAPVEICLAVVVAALAGRGLYGRVLSLLLAVPLAALGWFALRLGGFGV